MYTEDQRNEISYTIHSIHSSDEDFADALVAKVLSGEIEKEDCQRLLYSINLLAFHMLQSIRSAKDNTTATVLLASVDTALHAWDAIDSNQSIS